MSSFWRHWQAPSAFKSKSVAGCQFLASLHFIGCHAVLILVNIVSLPTFSRFGENCLLKLETCLSLPIPTQWWNKKNYFTSPLSCLITWFCKLSNTTVSFSKLPSFTKSQRVTWLTWDERPCNVGNSNLTPLRSLFPWPGCWHWPTPQLVPPLLHLSNLVADHLPKRNLL